MITRSFDRSAMSWSYDMHLQPMLSAADIEGLPFGSVFGSVPPGTASKRHAHQDGEMFIVLAGRAIVSLDGEERELGPGQVVHLAPFGFHEIKNDSDAPFDIVSIYWEHIPSAVAALEKVPSRDQHAERTLVFCPPPTPNGSLHLGHLAGPYVRADMLVRALRSLGRDVRYISGTDDHQSHVAVAARMRGQRPEDVATTAGDAIVSTLHTAGVGLDRLTRPLQDRKHGTRIAELFEQVLASSAVREEERPTAYCPACDLSLHQAFARGACPHCGEASDGEICEACGRPNEARDLKGVECRICGTPAVLRSERALWLDLDGYKDELRDYLRASRLPADLLALVDRLLADRLPPYRLTRTSAWGVDLGDGQVLDAWADLALTFLDAARSEIAQGGPAEVVLYLGYDNSFYYAVLLPALAFATGLAECLPATFVTNQFLHLGDAKFSTSRGHAIWADEPLAASGPDAVRIALLRDAPEGRVTRIIEERAAQPTDDPLYRGLQEWLRGFEEISTTSGGIVPGTGAWTDRHREFYRYLGLASRQLDSALLPEAFSARGYIRLLDSFVAQCAEFRAVERPGREVRSLAEESRTSLALEYLAAKVFAALAWPVAPETARNVWEWLGLPGDPVRETDWSFLPASTRCASPAPTLSAEPALVASGRP